MTPYALIKIIPLWNRLRGFGNSPAVKLTVLIPIVGYMIIFNAEVIKALALSAEFLRIESETAGVSHRLLQIYVGLCLLSVGSFVYNRFCPAERKRYESNIEYISAMNEAMSASMIQTIEARLSQRRSPQPIAEIYSAEPPRGPNRDGSVPEVEKERRRAILLSYYQHLNRLYPGWRLLTALCFYLGTAFLLWPSLFVFLRVMQMLFISGD